MKPLRILATLSGLLLGAGVLHAQNPDVEAIKMIQSQVVKVVETCQPATVNLMAGNASGSGVVVTPDGLILTAAHVTKGTEEMMVRFHDGRMAKAKVLGSNFTRDIGMAQIEEPGPWPFIKTGSSASLHSTELVVAMGHPGGYDIRRPAPVRIGRISTPDADGFLVSDCALVGGDSGGPLFNLAGEVVGIHSSIGGTLSFNRHAPVDAARADWERLKDGERWGDLGGNIHADDEPVIGLSTHTDTTDGLRVRSVMVGSPAAEGGLKSDDLIRKIGDRVIPDDETFRAELRRSRVGRPMNFLVNRAGKELTLTVKPVPYAKLFGNPKEKDRDKTAAGPKTPGLGIELSDSKPVRLTRVELGSPAAEAGLKAGDVLLAVNGQSVESKQVYLDFLKSSKNGQVVSLKIKSWEGEKTVELKVALH